MTSGRRPVEFAEHVLEIVRAIPPGRVMTYGDVAAVLGSRGARAVGAVMARGGAEVPWWRVVRAGGLAPRGHEVACSVPLPFGEDTTARHGVVVSDRS